MARTKSPAIRREPSDLYKRSNGALDKQFRLNGSVGQPDDVIDRASAHAAHDQKQAGLVSLAICVGGIYASFLSWAYLQERITTTTYGSAASPQRFQYPVFLNTIQSAFAAIMGYIYLFLSSPRDPKTSSRKIPAVFPSQAILFPLLLIAVTSSLASPFGYTSLKYIDYVTFILAKSCKLLPVMFLHISLFRKRYPLHKYAVVFLVTLGVAIFTLHHPSTAKKAAKSGNKGVSSGGTALGLFLLGINLLFDGLTNTVQDHIFATYKPFSGPQMMCAQNIMSTLLTVTYLFLSPYIAQTGLGPWVGMNGSGGELQNALDFVTRYPEVGWDVLAFAGCGAVGQVFIFHTLSHFSSLLLVTVTVTRKMLTMLLSIVLFGHQISKMQWLGVGLVFSGIGAEGWVSRIEKKRKQEERRKQAEKEGKKAL